MAGSDPTEPPDRRQPAGRGRQETPPGAPGWYPDTGQPENLRYWDGTAWTTRRRPRPDWTARLARRPNYKWIAFVCVAVVGAVGVGLAGEALRPKSPGPRVLTDAGYVRQANAECAKTLPGLRPAESGPLGQAVTPAQAAAQIDTAAGGLDDLAGRLSNLTSAAADRPHVAAWLDGWHRYASLGRRYAAFLRQHGNSDPGALSRDIVQQAKTVDDFALANGLKSCALFATPQPNGASQF